MKLHLLLSKSLCGTGHTTTRRRLPVSEIDLLPPPGLRRRQALKQDGRGGKTETAIQHTDSTKVLSGLHITSESGWRESLLSAAPFSAL